MTLRTKLLLVFVALAVGPLALVSVLSYMGGVGTVEGLLRERAGERAGRMARRVSGALEAQEHRLVSLASEASLREFVRGSLQRGPDGAGGQKPEVPGTVRAHFDVFFKNNREYFESITCFNSAGGALFRVRMNEETGEVEFQTENIVAGVGLPDERVWRLEGAGALRSPLAQETYGAALRVAAPVRAEGQAVGALVLEIRLERLLEEADEGEAPAREGEAAGGGAAASATGRHNVVALDNATGMVVYHTNKAYSHREAARAMPDFRALAERMRAGDEGGGFYDAPGGERWLAAFRQAKGLGLSLAVAENYTAATKGVRRSGLVGVVLTLAAGLAALALVLLIVSRVTRNIGRVTRGASAIAAGDLEQRIETDATDETRQLAESFNLMSDRLRELITQQAETRQFESFMRISAMLTHDLKNSITGLSMLVSNMELHFHREEFRKDAIYSLREATEKLSRTVSRLSEPVKSLSGEYRRDARATDLVPLIRRVLAANAEPARPLYDIETRLPETLVATVEPRRVEAVVENLVINALEAMGAAGGRLTVEAGREEGGLVFFSVADTGLGMTEEFIRTRLFRPFSTTKSKGIGLGLFTCREIVEAHGGRLEVESRPGAGTRFRVVLPSRLFKSGERWKRPSNDGPEAGSTKPLA